MLLAAATMACEEVGTVGQTSVGFAEAAYSDSFSLGTVYIPLTIEAEEGGENTADVELMIDVIDTDNCAEIELENGQLVNGDFMITAHDMVFRSGVKEVNIEIQIFNPDDKNEYSFTLEIVSSNTVIDQARKQCVVTIKKDTRDTIAGTYKTTGTATQWVDGNGTPDYSFTTGMEYNMKWNNSYGAFVMPSTYYFFNVSAPLVFNYREEKSTDAEGNEVIIPILTMPAVNIVQDYTAQTGTSIEEFCGAAVDGADPTWHVVFTARILEVGAESVSIVHNDVQLNINTTAGTITFPAGKTYALGYCIDFADAQGNIKMHYTPYSNMLRNPGWVKK